MSLFFAAPVILDPVLAASGCLDPVVETIRRTVATAELLQPDAVLLRTTPGPLVDPPEPDHCTYTASVAAIRDAASGKAYHAWSVPLAYIGL